MNTTEAIRRLLDDPSLVLSFTKKGEAQWRKRKELTEFPLTGTRSELKDKANNLKGDDLLILVLKLNPGLEMQLWDHAGHFPYLAVHTQGFKNLQIPEGMFVSDGHLCTTVKQFEGTAMLAKILK